MKTAALPEMNVDEFLIWSAQQTEGRYELFDGVVVRQSHDGVSMQAERVLHTEIKGNIFIAFRQSIAKASLACATLLDGATVRIEAKKAFEPDVLVYCGEKADPRSLEIPNPVIVVEVLSEGTAGRDMSEKLEGYFTVPSVMHYLIIDPEKRFVIHHTRGSGDEIRTRILRDGTIALEPPGISVALAEFFV